MKELLQAVDELACAEYDRAAAKFGPAHNSPHEAYAVIFEEFEEAREDIHAFNYHFQNYWGSIKANAPNENFLKNMHRIAEHAAAEWVQVAAMCLKALVKDGDI